MQQIDLKNFLSAVDVPADWVGIREVSETHTPRIVRDGVPQMNASYTTQGLMIEVLSNGQFGYYGTPNMTNESVAAAAKKAFKQAQLASRHATFQFSEDARPANVGNYQSHL